MIEISISGNIPLWIVIITIILFGVNTILNIVNFILKRITKKIKEMK